MGCIGIYDMEKGFHPYLFTDLSKDSFNLDGMDDETLNKFNCWYDSWVDKCYVF